MTRQRQQPEGQRQQRVGEEIRHALARIIERGHFRDPELAGVSVTITRVRMSPDLRHGTVGILRFGGGDSAALAKALNRAAAYFRGQIAHEVRLRYAPELRFEADQSFDRAAELERLFHDPAVLRDLAGTGEEDERDKEDGGGA